MSNDDFHGSSFFGGTIAGFILSLLLVLWADSCMDSDKLACRRALVAAHTANDTLAVLRGPKSGICLDVANELKERP